MSDQRNFCHFFIEILRYASDILKCSSGIILKVLILIKNANKATPPLVFQISRCCRTWDGRIPEPFLRQRVI